MVLWALQRRVPPSGRGLEAMRAPLSTDPMAAAFVPLLPHGPPPRIAVLGTPLCLSAVHGGRGGSGSGSGAAAAAGRSLLTPAGRRRRPPAAVTMVASSDRRATAPGADAPAAATSATTAASAAAARVAAADAEEEAAAAKAAANSASRGSVAEQDSSRAYPLAGVVGQDAVKLALLLCAVNPRIGGVCLSGRRGTAKSIMARALHALLPPIEVVAGSPYNIKPPPLPDGAEEGSDGVEREVIPTPFVQVPLNVTEDRLIGSVDVEASVKQGATIFQPGLLARAHRGVLYIDEINLLDDGLANILLEVISGGVVRVEREGISFTHPCVPLVIATYNPEEGDMRLHLLDRMAVNLSVDAAPLNMEQRLEAVGSATTYSDDPEAFVESVADATSEMATNIVLAREYLNDIRLTKDQLKYLATEAVRARVQGHRAELFASELARASAALEARDVVSANDLKLAVQLAILPRSLIRPNDPDQPDQEQPPPPPPPPQQQQDEDDDQDEEDKEEEEDEDKDEPEEPEDAPEIPEEFMFDPEGVIMDPDLLAFSKSQSAGAAGGRGLIFSQDRGRYIKAMLPRGGTQRLAVDATLRSAAPYQKSRRARAPEGSTRKVFVEQGDMRVKRLARKAGALIIFLVDASGSMALNRMNAAKGAAIRLLTEAYQTRDKICLIPFQGDKADVLLPPTKSIAMAKRRLETMPCGGGSPLAHGLSLAVRTGLNAVKGGDVGKVMVVCITDGRANVELAKADGGGGGMVVEGEVAEKMSKQDLKDEVLALAKQMRAIPGLELLCVDTENKFVSTGFAKEVADAAGGTYHYLPKATEAAVADVAGGAIAAMRAM